MTHVHAAERGERAAALSLLFRELPQAERERHVAELLTAAAGDAVCLDGLLVAREGTRLVGAALYVLRSDRTAFVWPPVADDVAHGARICDALLHDVGRRLDRAEARLGQCVLECDHRAERDALVRGGFAHVADLVFLERTLSEPLPDAASPFTQTTVYDQDAQADVFAALLERTYVGTLDCPLFSGQLSGRDALAGHALAGDFDPARWQAFHVGDACVGVLLLNEHSDQQGWEVVYMGVVPEERGRGYGRAMLIEGLHQARRAGMSTVFLACDHANYYALNMYGALGFAETMRRSVHVRFPGARTTAQ